MSSFRVEGSFLGNSKATRVCCHCGQVSQAMCLRGCNVCVAVGLCVWGGCVVVGDCLPCVCLPYCLACCCCCVCLCGLRGVPTHEAGAGGAPFQAQDHTQPPVSWMAEDPEHVAWRSSQAGAPGPENAEERRGSCLGRGSGNQFSKATAGSLAVVLCVPPATPPCPGPAAALPA